MTFKNFAWKDNADVFLFFLLLKARYVCIYLCIDICIYIYILVNPGQTMVKSRKAGHFFRKEWSETCENHHGLIHPRLGVAHRRWKVMFLRGYLSNWGRVMLFFMSYHECRIRNYPKKIKPCKCMVIWRSCPSKCIVWGGKILDMARSR